MDCLQKRCACARLRSCGQAKASTRVDSGGVRQYAHDVDRPCADRAARAWNWGKTVCTRQLRAPRPHMQAKQFVRSNAHAASRHGAERDFKRCEMSWQLSSYGAMLVQVCWSKHVVHAGVLGQSLRAMTCAAICEHLSKRSGNRKHAHVTPRGQPNISRPAAECSRHTSRRFTQSTTAHTLGTASQCRSLRTRPSPVSRSTPR